jgi:hypothetical protein
MGEYIVTRVRKAPSADGSHRHITAVCTEDGISYVRHEVVDSIRNGHTWKTRAGGYEAEIEPVDTCLQPRVHRRPLHQDQPGQHQEGQPGEPRPLLGRF